MLITKTELENSGIPISTNISTQEVELAIISVEEFYLKDRITDENYIDLQANPTVGNNPVILNGGNLVLNGQPIHLAGLKKGLYHIIFSYLLLDGFRRTRYSNVVKDSEYSDEPSQDDLYDIARTHWDIGIAFIEEVMEKVYGISAQHNTWNNLFEPLLY